MLPEGAAVFQETIARDAGGKRSSACCPGCSISLSIAASDVPFPAVPIVRDVRGGLPVLEVAVDRRIRILPVKVHDRDELVHPLGFPLVECLALGVIVRQ